jgi:hypothetical protein
VETPQAAPDSFYRIDESPAVLARWAPFSVSPTALALTLTIPPLACLLGALAWRRRFPTEAQRTARHRAQAARRALARLQAGEPAWAVVPRYLHERYDFGVDDPTPADAAAFLKRLGFAKERCRDAAAFFARCDAVRYTAALMDPKTPGEDAARLIQALEADPCAR